MLRGTDVDSLNVKPPTSQECNFFQGHTVALFKRLLCFKKPP